jgi:chromosome segregation ATPase
MADSIHELQEKLEHLRGEVLDISVRKTVGKDQLKALQNEIETTREKLNLVNKTFNELKEACLCVEIDSSFYRMPAV